MDTRLRLLQVEDSESDAELIARQLRKAGYVVSPRRVDEAEAMRAALRQGDWDLVVSDYRMPSFDAPSALELVKSSGLDIPFLVVSGTIGEDLAVSMMKAGAHDYLMKDNLTRLGAAVERELREAAARRERKEAHQRLRESEAHLALAVDSMGMGVFDHDLATSKVYYSEIARRHLRVPDGLEPSLEGFLESLHPEDRPRVEEALNRVFRFENNGHFAQEYRLKPSLDADERWISAVGALLSGPDGKPARFLGMVRDISRQKSAERELQFNIELIARITENSRDSIMLTDLEGKVRFVNPRTVKLFGFTLEEFQSASVHNLIHHHRPDGRPYPFEECETSRLLHEHGSLIDREEVHFHKDGTPVNVLISSVPLEINGGRVGNVFTYRDITARKQAEQALRRSDERFRKLFEAGIVGMLVIDGTRILEANDQFLRMLGYERGEFFASRPDWRSVTPPEHVAASEKALNLLRDTGGCPAFEKEYLRKDGTRVPALYTAVRLSGGPESEFLGFVLDITERKNLELQFRQAQKLESVGQLAGGVAHDFNNLLTVIMGYADMLLTQMEPDHPFRASVDQILGASLRAAGLTSQLLTFSRRNPVVAKSLSLNELILGVEKMLIRLIGEEIEISLSLDGDAGLIHADPNLVEQIILNLAVNARDAMPEGGHLLIETSRVILAGGENFHGVSVPAGNYVCLEVADDGTGMTPEVQARLFEPFFTTKEQGKGTGLGLSTVYGIVKQSGGFVSVQSSSGKGSSFRILFPFVAANAPGDLPTPRQIAASGNETVLLVEDEEGVRKYVCEILRSHGYIVLDKDRGSEALFLAREYQGSIDLLLTDVVLPGMKGSELIRQFHALRPRVPVLRMSGYPERFDFPPEELCFPYLQKPFKPEVLLNRIRKILDSGAGMSSAAGSIGRRADDVVHADPDSQR